MASTQAAAPPSPGATDAKTSPIDPIAQAKQVQEQLVNQKIIPKKTHWEDTIWKGPIDYISSHSGTITADLGGAVHSAQDSLHRNPGFKIPNFGGEQWRSRVARKTKAQVGEWLKHHSIGDYEKALDTAQVDGTGLLALHDIWLVDKLGFLKYVQESLQVTAPGHAMRFGIKLEELSSFMWEEDRQEKEAKEREAKEAKAKKEAEKALAADAAKTA